MKKMMFVAQADRNYPFLYLPLTAHRVSENSANTICKALNKNNYAINSDSLFWKVFECEYEPDYKRMPPIRKYKNKLTIYNGSL